MAIDEGGPTKHFSDQVWRQLPELKVKKVKVQKVEKEVPLFDISMVCPFTRRSF